MQSRIYARLFNLKDRQDLPAGNPAIPYPTAVAYDEPTDQAAPTTTPSPYLPQVPKPPQARAAQPATDVAMDDPVAMPETDLETEHAAASNTLDDEERQYLAEVEAAAGRPRTAAEERRLRSVLQQKPKHPTKATSPDLNAIWAKRSSSIREADEEMVRQRQLPDDSQFAIPAGASKAAEPVNYAEKEAKLNEQARMGLLAPPEMRPGSAKDQKRADKEVEYQQRLKAELPYENPRTAREKEENRLAELQFRARNPRNEDRGVKGFIRELLQNFAFGLSHAQGVPGISVPQALMLGGVGAAGGMANRSWNEQRMAEGQIPQAMQAVKMANDLDNDANMRDARMGSIGIREQAERRMTDKNVLDADYKMKALNIQEKYRNEYLDLLRSRDVYRAANDKVKADQAQQRIVWLEKRYKLDEKKAGLSAKSTAINTAARKSAALAKLNEQIRDAEDAGDAAAAAKLRSDAKRLEALPIN